MSKTIIALIAVIALVLIVNTAFFVFEYLSSNSNASEMNLAESNSQQSNVSSQNKTSVNCLDNYNLDSNTIIFYNLDELHSNNMKPVVNELANSYAFYWKNTTYDSAFNECLAYYQLTTPAFICAGTKAQLTGEVSKARLQEFASSCN